MLLLYFFDEIGAINVNDSFRYKLFARIEKTQYLSSSGIYNNKKKLWKCFFTITNDVFFYFIPLLLIKFSFYTGVYDGHL